MEIAEIMKEVLLWQVASPNPLCAGKVSLFSHGFGSLSKLRVSCMSSSAFTTIAFCFPEKINIKLSSAASEFNVKTSMQKQTVKGNEVQERFQTQNILC